MSIENLLATPFQDIASCAEAQKTDRSAFFKQFSFIPPTIGFGDGRMIILTDKGADAVFEISKIIRNNSAKLAGALSEKNMTEATGKAISQLLFGDTEESVMGFTLPTDLKLFKRNLQTRIECIVDDLHQFRTHLFGAWVFQGAPRPSVIIGPVHFTIREQWLQEATKAELLTAEQSSEIQEWWRNAKSKGEKFSGDSRAKDVIDTIGPCPWICEVAVQGHSIERSREKSMLAARIALATIGLSWNSTSSDSKQSGLLFDFGPHRIRTTLAYSDNHFVYSNRENLMRRGRFLHDTEIATYFKNAEPRFLTVGSAIQTFLTVEPQSSKEKLEAMLCRSIMWYGEALREPLDYIAIVKFAASLDTLAKGTHAGGICDLIERRYPIADMNAPFLSDGTSAKILVEEIYNTGRSQFVHGSRPSLVEDLDGLRARAELLTAATLRACIHWLHDYSGLDDEDAYRTA